MEGKKPPEMPADDKETFLARWSRRKREPPVPEKKEQEKDQAAAPAVPPVDSLTPESDFTVFMNPKVKEELRRLALKKLFSDPHFNVPDPFEPFSGDWTVGEPIPDEMLATLNQARSVLFAEPEKKPAEPQVAQTADEKTAGDEKQDESRGQDTQGL